MARPPQSRKIDELLDSILAEEPAHPQPGELDSGWGAMSEDEKLFEARKREQLIREKDLIINQAEEELQQLRSVHSLRARYLAISFLFVAAFSAASMAVVVQCGAGCLTLDSSVLIAILTTTMANVIGVLCIAFKWLFPKK